MLLFELDGKKQTMSEGETFADGGEDEENGEEQIKLTCKLFILLFMVLITSDWIKEQPLTVIYWNPICCGMTTREREKATRKYQWNSSTIMTANNIILSLESQYFHVCVEKYRINWFFMRYFVCIRFVYINFCDDRIFFHLQTKLHLIVKWVYFSIG